MCGEWCTGCNLMSHRFYQQEKAQTNWDLMREGMRAGPEQKKLLSKLRPKGPSLTVGDAEETQRKIAIKCVVVCLRWFGMYRCSFRCVRWVTDALFSSLIRHPSCLCCHVHCTGVYPCLTVWSSVQLFASNGYATDVCCWNANDEGIWSDV